MFLDPSPKVKEIKATISKWDWIKRKITCTEKETIDGMKRKPTEWAKIFADDMTFMWLKSSTYKQLMQDIPGGPVVKNPPDNAGHTNLIRGPGRFHMLWGN